MIGTIFVQTLRRSWKGALIIAASMVAMGVYIVLMMGDSTMLKQYGDLVKSMPFLVNALGGGDAVFMATPAGILNYAYYTWMVILLGGYAIFLGLNVTSAEEDRGIMDILLSMPVPRWRVIAEKVLAYTLIIIVAIACGHVALVYSTSTTPMFKDVTSTRLLESNFNMLPITLFILLFTVLLGAFFRRRSTATTVATVFLVGSFFVDMMSRTVPGSTGVRTISIFSYYDSIHVMRDGLVWGNVILLMTGVVLLAAGSLWFFQRRDVGV